VYYRVNVKIGHFGVKKSIDTSIFVEAENVLDAMKIAMQCPGVHHTDVPTSVKKIDEDEYNDGVENGFYNAVYRRAEKPRNIPMCFVETQMHNAESETICELETEFEL